MYTVSLGQVNLLTARWTDGAHCRSPHSADFLKCNIIMTLSAEMYGMAVSVTTPGFFH